MRDYLPRRDEEFDTFQENFIKKVQLKLKEWEISTTEFDSLLQLQAEWKTAWEKAKDKDTRTRGDVQRKNDARKALEKALRRFIKEWIAFSGKVSDAEREELGLRVRDIEPSPAPIPNRAPNVTIDTIRYLVHRLRLTDPENPKTRAKPKGVKFIQIFRYIGETAPTSLTPYQHVGDSGRFLFDVKYEKEDMGKMVFYIARYVNTRGIPGPFSQPISAAVS